nr:MAG TPA: Poxvirus P21 membrane protein [Caudoviricetes sp.]
MVRSLLGFLLCLTYLKCDPIIGFVVFGISANTSE